ncbi:site-specific DNA-methyltransferase [Polynucleobacter sp. JS-Safj-400b-B2]|nr:site-specific DNA-methyltransferase [Polynucleobacter sp. JS-Safj-400b-B2]
MNARLYNGDCNELLSKMPDNSIDLTISSPPYCMGKEYESGNDVATFIKAHESLLPEIIRITKPGGSICWQVGFHVQSGAITPLDFLVHEIMSKQEDIALRNRVVWTFGHGFHCTNRFSGRYEVVMWYTKGGGEYHFDLDAVRVPQKYPGKIANKGTKKGEFSGNPKGKNPSDIWDIPNVKANHVEKTDHPCQFPVALAIRLIRALAPIDGLVFDPFSGVASTGVAALNERRRFLGAELDPDYAEIAEKRLKDASNGRAKFRPLEKEIYVPKPGEKVAIKPSHFWICN